MRRQVIVGGSWLLCAGLGCASGTDNMTSTAASLGDAGSTATDGPGGTSVESGPTTDPMGTTAATTTPADSSDDGPMPTGDSTGTATCDTDPAACTVWILPDGGGSWIAEGLDADSTLAPTDTVRAAWDVEAELEGFVLTDTRIHVVDLAARQWVRTENRAEAMPEVGGDEIRAAYSVPGYWSGMFGGDPNLESVTLLSATTAYIYSYQIDTQTFVFELSTTDLGPAWLAPDAPTPADVRAGWLDVTNAPGWVQGDIMQLCGMAGDVGPYVAYFDDQDLYVGDAGYCGDFFPPVPASGVLPLSLPGAPAITDVGAALYNETMGLWAFRGE